MCIRFRNQCCLPVVFIKVIDKTLRYVPCFSPDFGGIIQLDMVSEVSSTIRNGATLPSNASQAKIMQPTPDYTDSSPEKAPDNHAEGESTEPPPPDYLSFWKVVLLTIALSLTIFCVSLVSLNYDNLAETYTILEIYLGLRTKQFSQLLFHVSQTDSTRLQTWVGTVALTFWPLAPCS